MDKPEFPDGRSLTGLSIAMQRKTDVFQRRRYKSLKHFTSFDTCVHHVLQEHSAGRFDLVSFDVFDTLLFRRCAPETVQFGVAADLGRMLGRPKEDTEKILHEREMAYSELSARNESAGLDFDAHLDEVNLAWVRRLVPDQPEKWMELAARARDTKIRYEAWACFSNPAMLPLLRALHERGVRMIFISDMYLGEGIVSELLSNCGLRHFFAAGYVSGDHALLKRTGRLFGHVLEAEGVPPERVLHVGDNLLADGRRPAEAGIRARVVGERASALKRMRYNFHYARRSPCWPGVEAANFARAHSCLHREPRAVAIGRDLLGPSFAAFIHGLIEYCQRVRPDAVYFLSREGLLLRDLYDEMVSTLGLSLPRGGYLCVSRLTASVASMRGYGLREIISKLRASQSVTVRRLMAPLCFEQERLKRLAADCGVSDIDESLDVLKSVSFARLAEHPEVQAQAKSLGETAREALYEYLDKRNFFKARRVIIVDVGWAGQIQEGLQLALSDRPGPELHGYYLGANANADERRGAGLKIRADFIDAARYHWAGGSVFNCVQLFEIPSRAPHGTVVGYRGGEPLLMPDDHPERAAELPDEPVIALLQEGIRENLRQYARYTAMAGMTAENAMDYARSVIARLIRLPRSGEIDVFASLTNVANFGGDECSTLADTPPSLFSPRKFLVAIRRSLWGEATTALRVGRLAALFLSVLKQPRICRNLPPQVLRHEQESAPAPACPETSSAPPPEHEFEAIVYERSGELVKRAIEVAPKDRTREPLTLIELGWLWLGYYLTGWNLRRKRLLRVSAGLMPVRPWFRREIYIQLPLKFKGRRFPRRLLVLWKKMATGLKSAGSS